MTEVFAYRFHIENNASCVDYRTMTSSGMRMGGGARGGERKVLNSFSSFRVPFSLSFLRVKCVVLVSARVRLKARLFE